MGLNSLSMDWYTERLVVKASSTRTRPESVMPNLIALRSSGSGLRWTSPCRSSRSSVGHNQVMASSLFLLALGEAVIHTQGPGGAAAFAAATYAYFPALILAALSGWGPGWARLTAGASGVAFGIHAFAHAGGGRRHPGRADRRCRLCTALLDPDWMDLAPAQGIAPRN